MSPTGTKKTVAKKSTKKKISRKKVVKKKVAKKKATNAEKISTEKTTKKSEKSSRLEISIGITSEERWRMIAVAAYHKAEKRGFASGNELQDWTEAEREIDKLMLE